jgi:phosphoserine phosphatase
MDLCGTVILQNTTRDFVAYLNLSTPQKLLRWFALGRMCGTMQRFGVRDLSRTLLVRCLSGFTREDLYFAAEQYVQYRLSTSANMNILSIIKQEKVNNSQVYLATASLDPIATAVKHALCLDGAVSSILKYNENQVCCGGLQFDCTGRKWSVLTEYVPKLNEAFVVVYTDNTEDVDLKEAADEFYFVVAG